MMEVERRRVQEDLAGEANDVRGRRKPRHQRASPTGKVPVHIF